MKSFLFIIGLLMTQGCAAQSQLAKEMPENVSFSLNKNGGMSRSYKKIRIKNNLIEFEELTNNGKNLIKWSANISAEDSAKLYQVFVENKFETIKNDERKGIVYDAGSESIRISANWSFHVTYGKNSPLSGRNLSRYQAVQKAINDLVEQYQNQKNQSLTLEEAEKFLQGKWRAAGDNNGHSWFLEWTFDNGTFTQSGYPPITQTGKYKTVSLNDNKITAELFDQTGTFGEEKRIVEIFIDRDANQLTISGTKGFARVD